MGTVVVAVIAPYRNHLAGMVQSVKQELIEAELSERFKQVVDSYAKK